jgi:hypothetical protein
MVGGLYPTCSVVPIRVPQRAAAMPVSTCAAS